MNTITNKLNELKELFNIFDNPKDKYIQLLDMGKEIKGLMPEERTDENKIYGCTSQAWVVTDQMQDQTYRLRIDSDALIVKGLLSVVQNICEGETFESISSIDGNILLKKIGLDSSISNQRTNGLSSALEKIKKDIICMETKNLN